MVSSWFKGHFDKAAQGIDFVRDRLTDSLQLLRHSAISSSVFSSRMGCETDHSLSSLPVISSLNQLAQDQVAQLYLLDS